MTCKIRLHLLLMVVVWFFSHKFAGHLRKFWSLLQVNKNPVEVIINSPNDVTIRTPEHFQEDIESFCKSETASTFGVITLVCYSVVLEGFKIDNSK